MSMSTPLDRPIRPSSHVRHEAGRSIVRHGLVAGALGFAEIAIAFAVVNLIVGRPPLHTAALLGAALFEGANDPASVTITAAVVAKYTIAHLAVFLGFGLLAAWLASFAERGSQLWFVALFVFVFIGFHIIGATQLMASPMEAALSAPTIWVAGILASILMAGYVIQRHPVLQRPEPWDDSPERSQP